MSDAAHSLNPTDASLTEDEREFQELLAQQNTNTGIEHKKLLMWLFLASDCMFFGTLISTHLIYRKLHPSGAHEEGLVDIVGTFDIELTTFSSFILLLSSFFMAMAVSAIRKGAITQFRVMTFAVIVFGLIFLGGQVYEFQHFLQAYDLNMTTSIFGTTFYVLTGTHGTHVAIGILWLLSMLIFSYSGRLGIKNAVDVEVAGLYWHFVDIVWIVIFTVVYLVEYIYP